MDADKELVEIASMAGKMGITPDAVRKRIARGTLKATKREGRWYVALDAHEGKGPASWTGRPAQNGLDGVQDAITVRQDDKDRLIEALQAQVASQGEALDARRREVQELHQLLARAALAPRQAGGGAVAPQNGTGRLDRAGHDSDLVIRDQLRAALAPPQTRRWWRLWL